MLKLISKIRSVGGIQVGFTPLYKPTHIEIDLERNHVAFRMQKDGVKVRNGCEIYHVIGVMCDLLNRKHREIPSGFSGRALKALESAYYELKAQQGDRKSRGVEGTNLL